IILLLIFHTIQSYINSLHDALPIWPSGDGTPDRLCLRFGPSTSLGCGIRPVRPGDSRIGRIRLAASRDPYPLGDAGAADAAFPLERSSSRAVFRRASGDPAAGPRRHGLGTGASPFGLSRAARRGGAEGS